MVDEKTEQEVAAEAASGDNDTGVTDDMLNAAAADAVVAETETEPEEIVEDLQATEDVVVEQETEETETLDEEGLPVDHAKRSDLGRKLSATHRRQDEFDQKLDRILGVLETQATVLTKAEPKDEPNPFEGLDPEDAVTIGDLDKYLAAREKKSAMQLENYNKTYFKSLNKLVDSLEEGERDAVIKELKVLSYDPSTNPTQDADNNFSKAERAMLRKQLAKPREKVSPITGKQEHSPIGTVTNQKVVTKETVLPKLDAAGMSYLAFVEREDGSDTAQALHKSVGKG